MPTDVAGAHTLLDMLDYQVRLRPDAIAVSHGNERLTFAELADRSTALAQELKRDSLPTALGDRTIGVLLEQSIDLVVAVWAVLRSGAAYLPLEPEYPEQRLAYMVADSGASVVLTHPALARDLRAALPRQVHVRNFGTCCGGDSIAEPLPVADSDQLAYVIYTSGSTGRPKGVAISHGAITHQMTWLRADGHLEADTRILHKTPISFDAAQWELLANAAGAHIVIGRPGLYRDPDALIRTVRDHQVTTLQAVPTLLRALVDTEQLGLAPTLTRVYSGGEALSAALARDLLRELPRARLTNLYGPTEAAINATTHEVTTLDLVPGGPPTVPIGRPVPGCTILVAGPDLKPVGPGEVGELLIGGPQLARGYLNRPELTSEKFATVHGRGNERYYLTGDIVRQDPEGLLHFLGRRDSQVKLRGHRIELEEVNHRIEEHPWVRRAASVVTADPRTGRDALVACIEFDPRQAALMDQGSHGPHHQSKASRVQVRAQLADPGVRTADELRGKPVVPLHHAAGTQQQRRRAFSRKTYRYYRGGAVTRDDILGALAEPQRPRYRRELSQLTFEGLSELMRWFGQFHSHERLLPKLAYASPGALYATQLLITVRAVANVADGTYYYHPVTHELHQLQTAPPQDVPTDEPRLRFHFLGRQDAIETVYKNNVREVLEIEVGHMLGTLEEALVDHGLEIIPTNPDTTLLEALEPGRSDVYLGSFDAVAQGEGNFPATVRWYVQCHEAGIEGVDPGLYRYHNGELRPLGNAVVEPKHVIAINQEVYKRSSFGISMVADAPDHWLRYVALGRALHHLQSNHYGLGLMSAGYSSKSGHPLPAALRLDALLAEAGEVGGPSYFAVGGKVSRGQIGSEGMEEDSVHMRGPAEMIKDDLSRALPYYMVPSRTVVFDRLPLSPNGKVDVQALADAIRREHSVPPRRIVEPHNDTERWLTSLWAQYLDCDDLSVEDDFFAMGGDSLTAVNLVNRINQERPIELKVQTLFRYPRLRELAAQVDAAGHDDSRLIKLNDCATGRPAFCWPGREVPRLTYESWVAPSRHDPCSESKPGASTPGRSRSPASSRWRAPTLTRSCVCRPRVRTRSGDTPSGPASPSRPPGNWSKRGKRSTHCC